MRVRVRAIIEDSLERALERGHIRLIKHMGQDEAAPHVEKWPLLRGLVRDFFWEELGEYLELEELE